MSSSFSTLANVATLFFSKYRWPGPPCKKSIQYVIDPQTEAKLNQIHAYYSSSLYYPWNSFSEIISFKKGYRCGKIHYVQYINACFRVGQLISKIFNFNRNKILVPHLTKDEHPPELASSPVSCELLVYFLCEKEGEREGLMWMTGTERGREKRKAKRRVRM